MRWFLLLAPAVALAQTMTIAQVVDKAIEQYPSTRISEEQIRIAASGISQARLAYLPKADAIAQLNRATRNNIYGMLLQQNVISPISGPPLDANAGTSVWGSATGFLLSWEPFDFGFRRASVTASEVARQRAEAGLRRSRFEVAALAADTYLTVLAAEQALAAAKAGQARIVTILSAVRSLVSSGLRPGVDESRTNADEAQAANQVTQAEEAVRMAKATLAVLLHVESASLTLDRMRFLDPAPPATGAAQDVAAHPAAVEQKFGAAESEARMKVLERSYYPKFNTQGTLYARGTGANNDFTTGGAGSGLGPNIYNWGLGFTMTFSLMDLPGLRVRKEIEAARGRAEQARYEQLLRDLAGQKEKAAIRLDTAQRIAGNTPVQARSAREAYEQASARYKAGLIGIIEVADTQRLLTAAEIDDGLARLSIWRAALGVAIAEGDLTGFLARASQ